MKRRVKRLFSVDWIYDEKRKFSFFCIASVLLYNMLITRSVDWFIFIHFNANTFIFSLQSVRRCRTGDWMEYFIYFSPSWDYAAAMYSKFSKQIESNVRFFLFCVFSSRSFRFCIASRADHWEFWIYRHLFHSSISHKAEKLIKIFHRLGNLGLARKEREKNRRITIERRRLSEC